MNSQCALYVVYHQIKVKTPSDPLEAELLMMADAIAGVDEPGDDNDNKSSSAVADEDSSTTHGEYSCLFCSTRLQLLIFVGTWSLLKQYKCNTNYTVTNVTDYI